MISLAPYIFPFSIISVGVSDPKQKIKIACKTDRGAVTDKMILYAKLTLRACTTISSMMTEISTPIILPKLKKRPNIFLSYLGAIYLR